MNTAPLALETFPRDYHNLTMDTPQYDPKEVGSNDTSSFITVTVGEVNSTTKRVGVRLISSYVIPDFVNKLLDGKSITVFFELSAQRLSLYDTLKLLTATVSAPFLTHTTGISSTIYDDIVKRAIAFGTGVYSAVDPQITFELYYEFLNGKSAKVDRWLSINAINITYADFDTLRSVNIELSPQSCSSSSWDLASGSSIAPGLDI